jgi:hypothetical protein
VIGIALLGAWMAAQAPAPPPVPPESARGRNEYAGGKGLRTSPSISETALASPTVEIVAESQERMAVARLGITAEDHHLALSLRAPLQDAPRPARPLSREGLGAGASAALTYNRLLWRYSPDHQRHVEACRKYAGKDNCTVSADVPADKQSAYLVEVGYRRPWLFGLSARVSQESFEWIDPQTLATSSDQHNNVAASGWIGTLLAQGFVVARYSYQDGYRSAPTSELCRPVGGGGASTCSEAALEGPSRVQESLLTGELRRYLTDNVAVTAVFRKNFQTDVWSWEVPFYFISGAKGGLTGGVSVGKRSDEKTVAIRVFVGAAFEPIYTGQ